MSEDKLWLSLLNDIEADAEENALRELMSELRQRKRERRQKITLSLVAALSIAALSTTFVSQQREKSQLNTPSFTVADSPGNWSEANASAEFTPLADATTIECIDSPLLSMPEIIDEKRLLALFEDRPTMISQVDHQSQKEFWLLDEELPAAPR